MNFLYFLLKVLFFFLKKREKAYNPIIPKKKESPKIWEPKAQVLLASPWS